MRVWGGTSSKFSGTSVGFRLWRNRAREWLMRGAGANRYQSSKVFFFTSRQARCAMKKKGRKNACQTSINTHPAQAPEGENHEQGRDHQQSFPAMLPQPCGNISLYSRAAQAPHYRHPCGQSERTKVFTLGCRGYTIINQGGFCGSFREPRGGRIL